MGQLRLMILVLGCAWSAPAVAKTIRACGGVMVTDQTRCEVRLSVGCFEGCTPRRMLKSCTTSMVPSCREVCTEPPPPVCTGNCGGTCEERCKVDTLVCKNGCSKECAVDCGPRCQDAKDPAHCRAACEANCGHECDVQCDELPVDASCLEHCYRCCSGSCTAQANLDCQVECQEGGVEGCQHGLVEACEVGCDADGSLFCDGQFIASGLEMTPCVTALKAARVPVKLGTDVSLESLVGAAGQLDGEGLDGIGCVARPGEAPASAGWWLLGLLALGRRRRSPHPARAGRI